MSISPTVRRVFRSGPGRFRCWLEATKLLVARWRLRLTYPVLRCRLRVLEAHPLTAERCRSPGPIRSLHRESPFNQTSPAMYWDEMDEILTVLERAGLDPILSISLLQADEIHTAHIYPEGSGFLDVMPVDDEDAEPIVEFYFDSVEELRLYFTHLDQASPTP